MHASPFPFPSLTGPRRYALCVTASDVLTVLLEVVEIVGPRHWDFAYRGGSTVRSDASVALEEMLIVSGTGLSLSARDHVLVGAVPPATPTGRPPVPTQCPELDTSANYSMDNVSADGPRFRRFTAVFRLPAPGPHAVCYLMAGAPAATLLAVLGGEWAPAEPPTWLQRHRVAVVAGAALGAVACTLLCLLFWCRRPRRRRRSTRQPPEPAAPHRPASGRAPAAAPAAPLSPSLLSCGPKLWNATAPEPPTPLSPSCITAALDSEPSSSLPPSQSPSLLAGGSAPALQPGGDPSASPRAPKSPSLLAWGSRKALKAPAVAPQPPAPGPASPPPPGPSAPPQSPAPRGWQAAARAPPWDPGAVPDPPPSAGPVSPTPPHPRGQPRGAALELEPAEPLADPAPRTPKRSAPGLTGWRAFCTALGPPQTPPSDPHFVAGPVPGPAAPPGRSPGAGAWGAGRPSQGPPQPPFDPVCLAAPPERGLWPAAAVSRPPAPPGPPPQAPAADAEPRLPLLPPGRPPLRVQLPPACDGARADTAAGPPLPAARSPERGMIMGHLGLSHWLASAAPGPTAGPKPAAGGSRAPQSPHGLGHSSATNNAVGGPATGTFHALKPRRPLDSGAPSADPGSPRQRSSLSPPGGRHPGLLPLAPASQVTGHADSPGPICPTGSAPPAVPLQTAAPINPLMPDIGGSAAGIADISALFLQVDDAAGPQLPNAQTIQIKPKSPCDPASVL